MIKPNRQAVTHNDWIKFRYYFEKRPLTAYAIVLAVVTLVGLLQYFFPELTARANFLFYFPTIFFIAWLMPVLPSIMAIVLSLISLYTLQIINGEVLFSYINIVRDLFFVFSCSIIVWITKRNSSAEMALQKNEDRLRLLYLQRTLAFKAANLGWWLYDPQKNMTSFDEGFQQIFGIDGSSCSTDEIYNLIHPEDTHHVRKAVEKSFDPNNDKVFSYEYRIILKDKTIRWIEAHGIPTFSESPERKIINLVGTVVDITSRKEKALRLLRSEERYRELFEKMQETYFVVEMITDNEGSPIDWTYVETNPQTEHLMGLSREEMIGKKYSDLVTNIDQKWVNLLGHVALTGNPASVEMYAPARSRWFGVTTYSPRPGQAAVLLTDIDERKKTEDELLKKREDLSRALEEANRNLIIRDDFLSIASHELKTPLTALQLQLGLIQRFVKNNLPGQNEEIAPLTKLVNKTLKQVGRLNSLVDDLLDVSRIQRGKLSFFYEEVGITSVINEAIEKVNAVLSEAGCAIEVIIPEDFQSKCDSMRIEQVVINLLTNAAKYAPGSKVIVQVLKKENSLRLEVKDHGPGIAAQYHDKVFQRFERAGANDGISGLGLGLYIVKSIIEGHGGNITFKSHEGQGTSFFIDLPMHQS